MFKAVIKRDLEKIIKSVPSNYYQRGIKENCFQWYWHKYKFKNVFQMICFSPKNILDVGCHSGWFLNEVSQCFSNAKCSGIDIYSEAINYGKKIYPHINFKISDAHRIPFSSKRFDLLLCTEVLEHVNSPREVLKEIRRVVKDDGKVIIEIDSGSLLFDLVWFFWEKMKGKVWRNAHLHKLRAKDVENLLLQSNFKIERKKTFNFGMGIVFLLSKKR